MIVGVRLSQNIGLKLTFCLSVKCAWEEWEKKKRVSLKKWWLLKRICDKSVWNLFGPVKAAACLWLAQAWFRFDLVPFDFEEVWKARDNRTQQKVLERNPMSRINGRHLVLALSGSERFELLSGVCWCLVPAVGSQCWFVFVQQPGWAAPRPGSVLQAGAVGEGLLSHPILLKSPGESTCYGNWGFLVEGGQELLHNLEVSKIQTKRAVRTLFPVWAGCNFYTKLRDNRRDFFNEKFSLFTMFPTMFFGGCFCCYD